MHWLHACLDCISLGANGSRLMRDTSTRNDIGSLACSRRIFALEVFSDFTVTFVEDELHVSDGQISPKQGCRNSRPPIRTSIILIMMTTQLANGTHVLSTKENEKGKLGRHDIRPSMQTGQKAEMPSRLLQAIATVVMGEHGV